MDVSYLNREGLDIIDERLKIEFRPLTQPNLLVVLHGPLEYLFENIRERQRAEEKQGEGLPEGLVRLVTNLHRRYETFV